MPYPKEKVLEEIRTLEAQENTIKEELDVLLAKCRELRVKEGEVKEKKKSQWAFYMKLKRDEEKSNA